MKIGKTLSTKSIVICALMAALTTAATYAVRIPTVATEGYVNLGDTVLLFTGIVFGPLPGFIAGGLGSCLADLAGGYAHWILPTFIIKGVEGASVGLLFMLFRSLRLKRALSVWLAMVPSAILMVAGYFAASAIMKGSVAVAFTSVPENCLQGLFSMILCALLLLATGQIKSFSKLVGNNYYYNYHSTSKTSIKATKTIESEEQTEDSKAEGADGE